MTLGARQLIGEPLGGCVLAHLEQRQQAWQRNLESLPTSSRTDAGSTVPLTHAGSELGEARELGTETLGEPVAHEGSKPRTGAST